MIVVELTTPKSKKKHNHKGLHWFSVLCEASPPALFPMSANMIAVHHCNTRTVSGMMRAPILPAQMIGVIIIIRREEESTRQVAEATRNTTK